MGGELTQYAMLVRRVLASRELSGNRAIMAKEAHSEDTDAAY